MALDFIGSFAIAIQHSDTPEKLFLVKKGIQGLYLGFSYDGALFASDVYGLVETCRYFVPVESDVALELSSSNLVTSLDPQVSILNLQTDIFTNVFTDSFDNYVERSVLLDIEANANELEYIKSNATLKDFLSYVEKL